MITINGELCKPVNLITNIEEHKDYYISIEGKVYSKKRKYLKEIQPCWQNSQKIYKIIRLPSNGKYKRYYLHRLVSQAFLLNGTNGIHVSHKNGDRTDNRAENLLYLKGTTRGSYRGTPCKTIENKKSFDLNENLIEEIKLLHKATQIKGMNVSNDVNDFFYEIMKGALDEYKTKYNLNKILYSLNNESQ